MEQPREDAEAPADARARILVAAMELLARGGDDALTTRAVATAAQVQAPTLYRLFGDKDGLLDAVAEHVFTTYMREKQAREPSADPVADLRKGWDIHVAFGLANPAVYARMTNAPDGGARRAAPSGAFVIRA